MNISQPASVKGRLGCVKSATAVVSQRLCPLTSTSVPGATELGFSRYKFRVDALTEALIWAFTEVLAAIVTLAPGVPGLRAVRTTVSVVSSGVAITFGSGALLLSSTRALATV